MAEAASPRDVVCFNVLLADGGWRRTTALLGAMPTADTTSFTHAVKSQAVGHWEGAVALLAQVAHEDLRLDAFLCSAVLKAERWQRALRLKGLGIRRDAVSWSGAVSACPAWQEAMELSSRLALELKGHGFEVKPCRRAFNWISPAPMPCSPGPAAPGSGVRCCIS